MNDKIKKRINFTLLKKDLIKRKPELKDKHMSLKHLLTQLDRAPLTGHIVPDLKFIKE